MVVLTSCKFFLTRNFVNLASKRHFSGIMEQAMREHGVVPDVVDVAPKETIKISYPSGVQVDKGNVLTPTQVCDEPSVEFPAESDKFYLLCMTDPDAPSRKEPTFREWHHWLVGNIPGSNVKQGKILSAYVGSGPPPKTGLHRYVFLVYQQPGRLDFANVPILPNTSDQGRGKFKIQKFAVEHKLGNPIAGNFYQAEYDDYVPKLYKQLGGA